ncbi:glycerol-3-phosphate dehydrogenase [Methylocystis parvus]|uniref:Glycerol-3-phosphate dehydrogenase n=1 Tax=Methylocystis parvus TaxID=134 RepID=A0A6B8MDE8_9HYPH|nr:glycerol-3-phosphate dehydrogenase [Methylocystis parvus]QGM99333.1 glycerol-3-phosphate dehydrogenase [Methylocystis parvus]WBK00277.1 glycerol-3-phosphate dehydrogenase [Methylocystis parvus OBBP]
MIYDLLIIGGGINGCAIARDAAGRGLSVRLVEQNDLASGTSSASTKLIHGGLRYLELYEFRLVHEALAERELLLAAAPHIIWPLKFVLPHEKGLRPVWMLRLGLFLYDHLARRKRLEESHMISLKGDALGAPLRESYNVGFTYSDCWVEDSRLVVLNALDAKERGATISVGTKLIEARRKGENWAARLDGGAEIEARALVNAAGPWVSQVIEDALHVHSRKHVRLVKGSHIVVCKLYEGDHAYILQNPDGRIVFAIPYERAFTLIGTTDVPYDGAPGDVSISDAETAYLLDAINHFLRVSVQRDDIVWSYSGLRPLYDDGSLNASVVTRDYAFDLDAPEGAAPALSIFGGKITTARRLAEHAMDELRRFFPPHGEAWTQDAAFPGGDIEFDAFLAHLKAEKPFLGDECALRLARAYGSRAERFLAHARSMEDLGRNFGCGLTEAELRYLIENEWARKADDVLWRRSKLGLHMSPVEQGALREHMGG